MAPRRTGTRQKRAAETDWWRKLSDGDSRLARAYRSWDAALKALCLVAEARYPNEGPIEFQFLFVGNTRRSWMIEKDGGRYYPIVASRPSREKSVIHGEQIRTLFNEAREALRPLHRHLKAKKYRNPRSQITPLQHKYPEAMKRVHGANLSSTMFVDRDDLPALQVLAAQLVSKEHPGSGAPSTVQRNAKRRRIAPEQVVIDQMH